MCCSRRGRFMRRLRARLWRRTWRCKFTRTGDDRPSASVVQRPGRRRLWTVAGLLILESVRRDVPVRPRRVHGGLDLMSRDDMHLRRRVHGWA